MERRTRPVPVSGGRDVHIARLKAPRGTSEPSSRGLKADATVITHHPAEREESKHTRETRASLTSGTVGLPEAGAGALAASHKWRAGWSGIGR